MTTTGKNEAKGVTGNSTTTPKYCSRCGALLITQWFDFGNGQYLCGLCHAYPVTITPLTPLPPLYIPPNNNYIEALNEIHRLNAALEKANERVAELEGIVKAVRELTQPHN